MDLGQPPLLPWSRAEAETIISKEVSVQQKSDIQKQTLQENQHSDMLPTSKTKCNERERRKMKEKDEDRNLEPDFSEINRIRTRLLKTKQINDQFWFTQGSNLRK